MARVLAVTYGSRPEADIAVARLLSEGIDAVLVTDSAGGFEPQLDLIRGVRVLVPEADLEDAREILGLGDDPHRGWSTPMPAGGSSAVPAWARSVTVWLLTLIVVGGLVKAVLDVVGR